MNTTVPRDQQQIDPVANVEGDADGSVTIIHYPGWPGKSEILRLFPVGPNCAKIVFEDDDGRPLANVEQVGRENALALLGALEYNLDRPKVPGTFTEDFKAKAPSNCLRR